MHKARHAELFTALVVFLTSIYLITYSGRIESGDSLHLFDTVSSFVDFGDLLLDTSAGLRPPQDFDTPAYYPLPTADIEPLQVMFAAPLYWLAKITPGIGLAHTVWLFNCLVVALAGGVIFLYTLVLGYRERTAVLAGLLFGLCTAVWPYSKSFFREPLTLLMMILAALFAERWRAGHYRSPLFLLGLVLTTIGMLLAKSTAIVALPTLLVILLPELSRANRRRALIAALVLLGLAVAVFALLALFGEQLGLGARYNPLARFNNEEALTYLPVALHTYLLSIGGSIWGTSPIVLLAIPGLWMLLRRGRLRYVFAIPLVLFAFAGGYALLTGAQWFGGLSWPPRFLIPVLPFLMLGTLPVLDRLVQKPIHPLLVLLVIALVLYSLWVQITGVALEWGDYTRGLPPEAGGLLEWGGGLNELRYLRWAVIPQLWSQLPLDFAWARTAVLWWPYAFGAIAFVSLIALFLPVFPLSIGRGGQGVRLFFLPFMLLILVAFGLRAINRDPYYYPDRQGIDTILATIDSQTQPGDFVILSNREYETFFLNHNKIDDIRVVALDYQPGDRLSEVHVPEVVSDNPDLLIHYMTFPFLQSLIESRDHIWLLENRGPDFAWAVRPVERFISTHHYPIQEIKTDPTVRLIEYSTANAPDPYTYRGAEVLTDVVFGDDLQLLGLTLPLGTTYQPGDVLPVSFQWQVEQALAQDVQIAWFLRTAEGLLVAQGMDSRPEGGFGYTSQWPVNVPIWDHRALRIPADAPPGEYQLWVKVYAFDAQFTPQDLPVEGGEILEGVIAVLPVKIEIRN